MNSIADRNDAISSARDGVDPDRRLLSRSDDHQRRIRSLLKTRRKIASEARSSRTGYGLVFIDGDHSYEGCAADIMKAKSIARPGGVIACHDYGEECCCPGVRLAVDQLLPGGNLTGSLYVATLPL